MCDTLVFLNFSASTNEMICRVAELRCAWFKSIMGTGNSCSFLARYISRGDQSRGSAMQHYSQSKMGFKCLVQGHRHCRQRKVLARLTSLPFSQRINQQPSGTWSISLTARVPSNSSKPKAFAFFHSGLVQHSASLPGARSCMCCGD